MPWQPWHWKTLVLPAAASPAAQAGKAAAASARAARKRAARMFGMLSLVLRTRNYNSSLPEDRLPGLGRGQPETLAVGDSDLGQLSRDLLALDVLGDGLQPQAHADLVDRLHQR